MTTKQTNKLWGSAFSVSPNDAVIAFTAGRDVASVPPADEALLSYDLWVNKVHAVMLAKTGIIPVNDAAQIIAGLNKLKKSKTFVLDPSKEDVHTNIESWLTEKLGKEVAGKLHTARSRNDQAVTDMKLYLRDQVLLYIGNCIKLTQTFLELAEKTKGIIMPGFTHHQHAMVTTVGHTFLGFASMILRDTERFTHWFLLHNVSPLGNTVSYGTTFPVDRKMTALLLGFDGPDHNSMDTITNRWEPEADLGFAVTSLMNHLSTIAETLILMATPEFGMVTLSDQYSTGSSIMPQKKNPDPLEVIKGKAGFAHGQLMSLVSLGKSNFIGYNRDSQWTKYIIMDLLHECILAPVVLSGVVLTMTIHEKEMEKWCHKSCIGATTLMEQLIFVYKLPMRTAKIIVEKAVKESVGSDTVTFDSLNHALADEGLSLPITKAQVTSWQDPTMIIALTKSYGGPGKNSMKTSLKKLKHKLTGHKAWVYKKQKEQALATLALAKAIQSLKTKGAL